MAAYPSSTSFNQKFQKRELNQSTESEILLKTVPKDIPPNFPIDLLVQLIDKQMEIDYPVRVGMVNGKFVEESSQRITSYDLKVLRRYKKLLIEGGLPLAALSHRFPHIADAYKFLYIHLVRTHQRPFQSSCCCLPTAHIPQSFPTEYLIVALNTQSQELEPGASDRDILLAYRNMLMLGEPSLHEQGYRQGCEDVELRHKLRRNGRPHDSDYSWRKSPQFRSHVQHQGECAWQKLSWQRGIKEFDSTPFKQGYCDGYQRTFNKWLEEWEHLYWTTE